WPEDLRAAVDNGVVKVNLDSETQFEFTRAAAGHMLSNRDGILAPEPARGDKHAFDPRAWGGAGRGSDGGTGRAGLRGAQLCRAQHRGLIRRQGSCGPRAAARG